MTQNEVIYVHSLVDKDEPETYVEATNIMLEIMRESARVESKAEAVQALELAYHSWLSTDQYELAALLAWGDKLFNPRPKAVQLVWHELQVSKKILCMGGSAQTKTYGASVRTFMRWTEDPHYTTVKLISTTGGHAKANIYSTFVRLHKESIIPMPGEPRMNYIGMDPNDLHSAIAKVSIQPGESGEAALKGFHPLPRPKPHPKFGEMSYSIALLDEAGNIPYGAWKGVDNIAATQNVQVYAATNPVNQNDEFGTRAEPLDGGWSEWDREDAVRWLGQQGWIVLRLDPAKSENVVQKRMVYEGFMSYEGFLAYEQKGTNHPDYDIYGRGRYPAATAQYNVCPANVLNITVGTVNFLEEAENWGSFDGGYALGGDAAILTTGRYGLADNFMSKNGELFEFPPKMIAIAEQQFDIPRILKDGEPNSILMGDELLKILTGLHVRPEMFVMDKTGNGLGVYDYLRIIYGNILGVEWGEAATNLKILDEDSKTAEEQFSGIRTEMWFGCSIWMEYGNFKIHPRVQTQNLFAQLGNRKYTYVSKSLRLVESKADYKKNNRDQSPNEADSLIMAPQLLRTRTEGRPTMGLPPRRKPRSMWDELRRSSPEPSEPRPAWVDI